MNKLKLYTILSLIIFVAIILSIFISIIISGSRTSGIGYGQLIGVFIGNLIYSILINRDKLLFRFLKWLIVCIIIAPCIYFSINYIEVENTILLILISYFLPSIIAWEILSLFIKKIFKTPS